MKFNQKTILLALSLAFVVTSLDAAAKRGRSPEHESTMASATAATASDYAATANGGAGAETAPALESAPEPAPVAAPASAFKALAKSKNIVTQLRACSLGVAAPLKLDLSYLQRKSTKTIRELANAQANNNYPLERELESQLYTLYRVNRHRIEKHQALFRAAFKTASTALVPITTLADARALLAAIPAKDLFNRMALCYALHQYYPDAQNLDDTINLRAIIEVYRLGNSIKLDFNSINAHENHETLAQLIVNFVLATRQPTGLVIKNASGSLAFISLSLRLLTAWGNPALMSLAGLNAPNLSELNASQNPALTSLAGINAPNLTALHGRNNPALIELGDDFYAPRLSTYLRAQLEEQIATNRARIAAEAAAAAPEAVAMPAVDSE